MQNTLSALCLALAYSYALAADNMSKAGDCQIKPEPGAQDRVLEPGERVVTTFGNSRVIELCGQRIIRTYPTPTPSANAHSTLPSRSTFDVAAEFTKISKLKAGTPERHDAAQDLLLKTEREMAAVRGRAQQQAAQRSGAAQAEANLKTVLELERAAIRSGRIKPGDVTIQAQNARKQLAETLALSKHFEREILGSDQEFNRLVSYRDALRRDLGR